MRCEDDCDDCDDCDCGCSCHSDPVHFESADFDADELGLDPEEDVERSLNERAARLLMRRPMYPGEIVN